VATAAIVLALGLPRFLIVCQHGDEAHGHLEFATAEGDCCEAAPERLPCGLPSDGERVTGAADCEHTAFDIELAPTSAPPTIALAAPVQDLPQWLLPAAHRGRAAHPPSTGPPRPDPGLCARATIRLQL
jgi:hypothetical protein